MNDLIVIAYLQEAQAAAALATLQRLQDAGSVDLENAVTVVKDHQGRLAVHQSVSLTRIGAATGGISGGITGAIGGALIGGLAPMFVLGAALGAVVGALLRNLTDYGIDAGFVKDLGAQLEPANSALLMLVRAGTPGQVLPQLSTHGGTVLHTTLSPQAEADRGVTCAANAAPCIPMRDHRGRIYATSNV